MSAAPPASLRAARLRRCIRELADLSRGFDPYSERDWQILLSIARAVQELARVRHHLAEAA